MRQAKACSTCRARRRKCVNASPGGPCTYCRQRKVHCSSSDSVRRGHGGSGTALSSQRSTTEEPTRPVPVSPGTCSLPAQPICRELVQLYFDYVHDQFHTLFHQPTFMEDVENGNVPPILVFGMMALSARFSTTPSLTGVSPRDRGKKFANQCEILLDWNDVSVSTIQACVLLGAIAITEGKPASESIHYAVACRIAQLLDLPNRKTSSRLEQEINIRIWWTLSMIDTWSSAGVRLPRLLISQDDIPLPKEEVAFLKMRHDTEISSDPTKSSLLAEMVRLNRILYQINEFNIKAAESEMDALSIVSKVEFLSKQLDTWLKELPSHIQDTPENMARFASQGLGRVFVAIYLGYYHFGQMLFYRFLHEDSQALNMQTRYYANKCKHHAASLCEILYASERTPGCDVKYNMVGHVIVISSTVQISCLLFESDEASVALAKKRLERNFCILNNLCGLWPTLDFCMERLMAFHEACKSSADTSFRMDSWMVRFLVEFASPVNDVKFSHLRGRNAASLSELGINTE